MNEKQKKEIEKIVREVLKKEFPKLAPEFFSKTLLQIRQYFIKNIK